MIKANDANRRDFLRVAAAALAGSAFPMQMTAEVQSAPNSPSESAILLNPAQQGHRVPANFLGLSYETSQLADPTYFSPANRGLISFFSALSAHGVLRIGGNTSDFGWFQATRQTAPPPRPANATDTGVGEPAPNLSYAVTPESIHNLRSFLDASGWTCIYGLNFGTGTPARAAAEAAYVARILGPKLEYFQIGNEPDLFIPHLRPAGWTFDNFFDEWLTFVRAIEASVPAARFGLPDGAGNSQWLGGSARRIAALPNAPNIAALSHHYYIGGPPTNPGMTIARILAANPGVSRSAAACQTAAAQLAASLHHPVAYRMTEGNTCYRGGKPGVSDVFAASLWAADYLLQLASAGYAGVNLHGGSGKHVADSLGGHLPGEDLLTDPSVPDHHPRPFYTPIAELKSGAFAAEPVYFGMRLAGLFTGSTLIGAELESPIPDLAVYAAEFSTGTSRSPTLRMAILNKHPSRDVTLTLRGAHSTLYVYRLSAPSLDSTEVSFGIPGIAQGRWLPGPGKRLVSAPTSPIRIPVPRASGLFLSSTPLA